MPTKATTKTLRTNVTNRAIAAVGSSKAAKDAKATAVVLDGLLFADVARAARGGVEFSDLAADLTSAGYKADDTTAAKVSRYGSVLLIDRPEHDEDAIYGWAHKARTAVNNAVRYGIGLPEVDAVIAGAKSTDEAITNLTEAAKARKDAKAAESKGTESGEDGVKAPTSATDLLNTAAQCLIKAVAEAGVTADHLPILRAIAEAAGNAALSVEAGEPVAA